MPDQPIELFLKWRPAGNAKKVHDWLASKGLSGEPGTHSLVIMSSVGKVEKAFGVSLAGRPLPSELPVPKELSGHVEAIQVAKRPELYP
jgi:hypothetical protein